jgi:acyl-coenzyme A synthetase/AMP-(fatty) acid ligase
MTTDLPVFPLDHLPLFGEANAPALIIRDSCYNYKELNLRIGRLAAFLKSKGFVPGDRVATWLGKGEIACLMPLASVRAGLVHVPVNPVLKAPQVRHILSDSGARLLITNAARASTLDGPEGHASFEIADEKSILAHIGDSEAQWCDPLPSDTDPDRLAAILYTSGSTGRPKGRDAVACKSRTGRR